VLLAQDVWQVATDKGNISRALQRAGNSELPVMRCPVDLIKVSVGRVHVSDPGTGQLLRKSALVRLKRTLAAPSRLGRVSRNMVNAQLLQGSADLGQVNLVDLAASLWGNEVVATPIRVQRRKQAIAGNGLADAMKA